MFCFFLWSAMPSELRRLLSLLFPDEFSLLVVMPSECWAASMSVVLRLGMNRSPPVPPPPPHRPRLGVRLLDELLLPPPPASIDLDLEGDTPPPPHLELDKDR